MTYEEFKEEFQEITEYLPEQYRGLQVTIQKRSNAFKKSCDTAAFSDLENPKVKFREIDLKGIYNRIKDKLNKNGVSYVFAGLSKELTMLLEKAYKDSGILEPKAKENKNLMVNIEKNRLIYDLRCEQVQDTLDSVTVMEDIAKQENSDLLVVPFQGQLVLVAEKEVQNAGGTVDDFVTEAEIFMLADGGAYGKNVFLYDMENKSLSVVESKSMVRTI